MGIINEIKPKVLLLRIKNKIENSTISGLISVPIAKNIDCIIVRLLLFIASKINKSESVSETPNKYKLRTLSSTKNKTKRIGNISNLFEILYIKKIVSERIVFHAMFQPSPKKMCMEYRKYL